MRGLVVAVVAGAALLATGVANAGPSCPGRGCAPIGRFRIPVPQMGEAAFYVVTITGQASKVSAVGAAVLGQSVTGNREMAAFAPKPTVKAGKATIRFYVAIANPKSRLKASARAVAAAIGLEAFASPLLLSPSPPVVKQETRTKFADDYDSFGALAKWLQYWESYSSTHRTAQDVMHAILAVGKH
jgi:hypothetical protein